MSKKCTVYEMNPWATPLLLLVILLGLSVLFLF